MYEEIKTEQEEKPPVIEYYKLESNGKATIAKPIRIVSSCNLDIFRFPFDSQSCNLSFGSYVYTGRTTASMQQQKQVNGTKYEAQNRHPGEQQARVRARRAEKELRHSTNTRRCIKYEARIKNQNSNQEKYRKKTILRNNSLIIRQGRKEGYRMTLRLSHSLQENHGTPNRFFELWVLVPQGLMTHSTREISIQRSPIVYVINLIIPACFLVVLDVISMFIQMGTEERIGFKIAVVLGFSVLLLILNDMLPNAESPPALGIFCCVSLAVMVLSITGCISTSYMQKLSDTEKNVPPWIKTWVMIYLARILLFKTTFTKRDLVTVVADNNNCQHGEEPETNLEFMEKRKRIMTVEEVSLEVKLLKRLLLGILNIHKELILSRKEDCTKSEWHVAALVVDRLVFFIHLFIIIIVFIVLIVIWAT
ncbi:5-hydroxytryptamine receptor 3A-like [Rhinophrynus dorsalis]